MYVIRIIVAVDLRLFSLLPFPFRFRYLQENSIEELPNEAFNGLSRLKILFVKLCLQNLSYLS